MQEGKISLTNMLLLILFISTFYVRTIFPFGIILLDRIFYIEFFLFLLIVISYLDFNKILYYRFNDLNLFHLIIFLSLILFLFSSFYFNAQYNIKIKSIIKLFSYFIIIISFFFIFAKQLYLSDDYFDKFTNVILVIGTLLTSYALIDFFVLRIYPYKEYSFSAPGIFAHPNNAAFIYTLLIPLVFYKYFNKTISINIFIILFSLFFIALLFTFSRAGYLGTIVTILVLTFLRSKIIFFIALFFLLFVLSSFLLEFAFTKQISTVSRAMLIITAFNMIIHDTTHFLWGYGVYNAIDVFINEKIYAGNFEDVVTPHNLLLLLTIQFGSLFTISLIVATVYVYIKSILIKRIIKSDLLKLKINTCIAITMGFITQDLLEGMIGYPEYFVMPMFLIFFGYLYYAVRFNKTKEILLR